MAAQPQDVFDRIQMLQDGPNTLTGAPAGSRAKVPSDGLFGEQEYLSGTVAGGANLVEIGSTLIGTMPELRFLADSEIGYLWKKKGSMRSGKPVLGEVKRVSPILGFYSELQWVVILHAPNVLMLTNRQLEAAIYHELSHLMFDEENENVRLRGHDLEMFRDEVNRYGLWTPDLESARETFAQLPLLDEPAPIQIFGDKATTERAADAIRQVAAED